MCFLICLTYTKNKLAIYNIQIGLNLALVKDKTEGDNCFKAQV